MATIQYNPFPTVPAGSSGGNAPYQNPRVDPGAFGGQIGQAVQRFGGALEQATNQWADVVVRNAKEVQNFDATAAVGQFSEQANQQFIAAQRQAPPNGVGFSQQAMKAYDDLQKQTLESQPEWLRPRLQAQFAQMRAQQQGKATLEELRLSDNHEKRTIAQTVEQSQIQMGSSTDPKKDLEGHRATVTALINNSSMTASEKEVQIKASMQAVEIAAAKKMIELNPRDASVSFNTLAATNIISTNKQNVQNKDSEAAIARFNGAAHSQFEEARRGASSNGAGFSEQVMKNYDELVKKELESHPARLRPTLEALFAKARESQNAKAVQEEFRLSDNSDKNNIAEAINRGQINISASGSPLQNLESEKEKISKLIDSSNLPLADKEKAKKTAAQSLEVAAATRNNQDDPQGARRALGEPNAANIDAVAARVFQVESAGNPNAKNPKSSALGVGQFIGSTWLAMIRRHKPELAEGKSEAAVLEMRRDPKLSMELGKKYLEEGQARLKAAGIATTPGNTYLTYFLGHAGAIKLLSVSPSTPVSQVVTAGQIEANQSILGGGERRTVGDVIAWANRKMGDPRSGTVSSQFQNIPYQQRQALLVDATNQARTAEAMRQQNQTKMYSDQMEALQLGIATGQMGRTEFSMASETWMQDKGDQLKILRAIETQEKKTENFSRGTSIMATPGAQFGAYSKQDKDAAAALYDKTPPEAKLAAGATIAQRGYVVPEFANQLRSATVSNDPKIRAAGLSIAARLMESEPNSFVGGPAEDLQKTAALFRSLVVDRGMTDKQAVDEMIKRDSDEFKAKITPKSDAVKQFTDTMKKTDPTSTVRGLFGQIFNRPDMPISQNQSARINNIYADAAGRHFAEFGDKKAATRFAADEIKRNFGVDPNGRIMQYPIDKSGYPKINGDHKWVYDLAARQITEMTKTPGIKSEDIFFIPTLDTPQAWKDARGQVPYYVGYRMKDANGQTKIDFVYSPKAGVLAPFKVLPEEYDELARRLPEELFVREQDKAKRLEEVEADMNRIAPMLSGVR